MVGGTRWRRLWLSMFSSAKLLSRLECEVNERDLSMTFVLCSNCEAEYLLGWHCGYMCALRPDTLGTFYVRVFHIKIGDLAPKVLAHIHRCHTIINVEGRDRNDVPKNLYCYYFVAQYGIQPNHK